MKKSEKENLKKAFNIPEPERKEYFVSLYNKKLKKNEPKFSVFFRYASTAVFAVLIIGLWGNIRDAGDVQKFTTIDEPTTAVQTTTVIQPTEKNAITTLKEVTTQTALTKVSSVQTTAENPPETNTQITIPVIPEFVPSVTEITFPLKPETSTKTKPVTTVKTVQATTVKCTATEPIKTDDCTNYEPTPMPVSTTMHISPSITTKNTEYEPPNPDEENTVTTKIQDNPPPVTIPSVTIPSPPAVDTVGIDYTVTPIKTYNQSEKIIHDNRLEFNDSTSGIGNAISMDKMIDYSDYIVLGKIDKITYTHVNGIPYTQEDITIYNVYKGNKLYENDKISVYIPGGYMPVREFENLNNMEVNAPDDYSVYYSGGNKTYQTVGTLYIFFLTNGSSDIPNGAFELTMKTDISMFQASNGEYISIGNHSLRFDIKSLLNL